MPVSLQPRAVPPATKSLRRSRQPRALHACPAYRNATQTVWGVGPADADVVLVGEHRAPSSVAVGREVGNGVCALRRRSRDRRRVATARDARRLSASSGSPTACGRAFAPEPCRPARRACDKPIAIACLRLFTRFPERPLLSLPRFNLVERLADLLLRRRAYLAMVVVFSFDAAGFYFLL